MIRSKVSPNKYGTFSITVKFYDEEEKLIELSEIAEENRRFQLMFTDEAETVVGEYSFENSLIPDDGKLIFTNEDLVVNIDNNFGAGRNLTFVVFYTNENSKELSLTETLYFTINTNLAGLPYVPVAPEVPE